MLGGLMTYPGLRSTFRREFVWFTAAIYMLLICKKIAGRAAASAMLMYARTGTPVAVALPPWDTHEKTNKNKARDSSISRSRS